METADGHIIKESLVILQYLEDIYPERPVAQRDPTGARGEHADADGWRVLHAGLRVADEPGPRPPRAMREGMLKQYAQLNDFLLEHAPRPFLFEEFGGQKRFTPSSSASGFWSTTKLRAARRTALRAGAGVVDACMSHPAAQQVTKEEVVSSITIIPKARQRRVAARSEAIVLCLRA